MEDSTIEICPIAYCRGRTFNDAYILCDEVANITPHQLLMLCTRLGENSKMVLTGDVTQSDLLLVRMDSQISSHGSVTAFPERSR